MIRIERVSVRFGDGPWAVREVDLAIRAGEWVAVIGESGSGKTTLLRTINRLTDPTEGRVFVAGQDVARVPVEQLRRGIGYVMQSVGLFPHWTVAENVAVVPRLVGWPEERVRARVTELLATIGLPDVGARPVGELSGGQRQRVGVARAIAAEPPVLLLDEAFGALDPVTRDGLQDEVRALHERLGLTTVAVTHDMAEALKLADRIAVMHAGAVIRVGTPAELVRDPGDPRVAALLEAPRRHATLLDRLRA